MTLNLIITCVSQKRSKKEHSILDPDIKTGSIENVFDQWQSVLSKSALKPMKALELYKGNLWNAYRDAWGIINNRIEDSKLWILSAGYGLINANEKIIPYNITFQDPRNGVPSILAKIKNAAETDSRRGILQKWWELLSKSNNRNPASLMELIAKSGSDEYFLLVLGKDYLEAAFRDLKESIKKAKDPQKILVISNNVNDPLAKRLGKNWLFADGRFVNLPRSNNTLVNAKIAKEILWHMFNEQQGLSWWSSANFNKFLKFRSSTLPEPKKPIRKPSTDKEVKTFVKNALKDKEVSFSRLHRSYRDSGRACEYGRFKSLYHEVKNELKNSALQSRPKLPVHHIRRKTKMLFFIPDWDDRVDPLYDFESDLPTLNRDPYNHDAYHYELYGHLNCDGILVSKSVLEANAKKREKASALGIHRYLRLPTNVPVIGDCGAFNYITHDNPPYETNETLQYYEKLDFDYGVSIDHLIVPGILKKKRYFKKEGDNWIKINANEFNEAKTIPNTSILKSRKFRKQGRLFDEEILLVEEIYLDENERMRRYELTVQNAKDFIEGHKKRRYSFIPIGAVQGWDPESYANAVNDYQKMGYTYIALGGLVKSKTPEILEILEKINKIKKQATKLHLFGVSRLDAIKNLMKLGISSVDSAGMLRQAWLSSSSNYYSPDMNHYVAIRVPPVDKSSAVKNARKSGIISESDLLSMENECLSALRGLDHNKVSVEDALEKVMEYSIILGINENLIDSYKRTLIDKPWKNCPCKLCQNTGIDIIIFRRNNRNRRRGFHNTWVFFNKFKELTTYK
jgi:hypothetical protein